MHAEIAIIDYEMGNLGSVKKKLDRIGVSSIITSEHEQIINAKKIILPGVGHFAHGVKMLKEKKLWDILKTEVEEKEKPILGICLGMQLMAKHSQEGDAFGFGWFDAEVIHFKINDTRKYKVPHMGWNSIELTKPDPLFQNVPMESGFYFVHSYHIVCNHPADSIARSTYEYDFTCAIRKKNIAGVQFHPEKSHEEGEKLLINFCKNNNQASNI